MAPLSLAAPVTVGAGSLAAARSSPVDVVEQVAATVTGLTIILAALWWFVRPRVQEYVRTQQRAAAQLQRNPSAPDTMADKLDQVVDGIADLRTRAEHNAAAIGRVDERVSAHRTAQAEQIRLLRERVDRIAGERGHAP